MNKENITSIDLVFDSVHWKKGGTEDAKIEVPHERDYESIKAGGFVSDFKVRVPLTRKGNVFEASFRLGICKEEETYFIIKDYSSEADHAPFEAMKIGSLYYSTWLCKVSVDLDTNISNSECEPEYIRGEDLELASTIQIFHHIDIRAFNSNKQKAG